MCKKLKFLLLLIIASSMALAMDTKHAAELNPYSQNPATQAPLAPPLAHHPNLAATANLGVLAKQIKKNPLKQPSISQSPQTQHSFALKKPILPWPGCAKIKKAKFDEFAQSKDSWQLYLGAHDPDIKKLIQEAKAYSEYCSILDREGKSLIHHAIENNDAPFIATACKHLTPEQQAEAIIFAGKTERPRVLLALMPKEPGKSAEKTLAEHFYSRKKFSYKEFKTYKTAQILLKKHARDRASFYNKVGNWSDDFKPIIIGMLEPTQEAVENQFKTVLHPQIIPSIKNENAFKRLLYAGYFLSLNNQDGQKILRCLIKEKEYTALEAFISSTPHIPDSVINKICNEEQSLSDKDKAQIAEIVHANRQKKNELLEKSWQAQDAGSYMQALNTGAVIESENLDAQLIILLVGNNPENRTFFNLIIQAGISPDRLVACNQGIKYPLLFWAIFKNNPGCAKVLIEAGANPNVCSSNDKTIGHLVLKRNNLIYLKMFLAAGGNPDAFDTCSHGKKHSLLGTAISSNNPKRTQALLAAGANPNEVDAYEIPLLYLAYLKKNPLLLKIMLNAGANPNTRVLSAGGNKLPLLLIAINDNRPEHFQTLLQAGARFDEDAIIKHALAANNPIFLIMLLEKGLDPHKRIEDADGYHYSLPTCATLYGKLEQTQCLIDAQSHVKNPQVLEKIWEIIRADWAKCRILRELFNFHARLMMKACTKVECSESCIIS